ncbi:RING-type E3 ubiquitin transferase MAG2 [Aspergillus lucknowensis]|uniref:RING-type domain-containing protein n=1 Tax=Aspergillus lucknowensis TaxID=176173 RepID=A0ABR4LGZ8_9EURO
MSSNTSQPHTSSKAVNIPNKSLSSSFHHAAPVIDNTARRVGGSGSVGAGLVSRNPSSPRNNQALKSQHKRQRRPRLWDDDLDNSAIMRSTTSRKGQTSITHLMNFSLPPRPEYHPPPRNPRRYNSWGLGSGYHAMDKARYVHANYRFIVTPNRAYHAQAANADVHLDWDSVLQILVSAQTQSSSCPICLSTPVAPRMARCGHIFCLPCLIRYMHSTDDETPATEKKARWKKCPICWDSIYISETRPVRWFSGQEGVLPYEGGDVVLRLVKRVPRSTLALPRDGAESLAPEEDIPWYHGAEVADYARIMKGGEDYMKSQYDLEISELHRQEQEDELLFGDDATWTQKAVAAINDSKQKVQGIGNPPEVLAQPPSARPHPIALQQPPEDIALMYDHHHAAKSGKYSPPTTSDIRSEIDQTAEAISHLDLTATNGTNPKQKNPSTGRDRKKSGNAPHPSDQPYYFYQALPHFYLSPLDIRILKAAFGDYSLFPATILPRVERISAGHIMDDELRKRVKYLSHLPQGCEVCFLECDWRDVVTPDILEQFGTEIEKRRKRNREKDAREEKSRVKAEKEEDEKRWAAARRKGPSISADNPPFSDRDFLPLASGPSAIDSSTIEMASSASPPRPSSHFSALASPSTSPPGSRTVWGTAAVAPPSRTHQEYVRPTPHDGWREGWEDELLAHQESEVIAQTTVDANNTSSAKKKGKKKNKITLMSTNIQRGA